MIYERISNENILHYYQYLSTPPVKIKSAKEQKTDRQSKKISSETVPAS